MRPRPSWRIESNGRRTVQAAYTIGRSLHGDWREATCSDCLLAVLIAAVGIIGVLAFSVGARTTEIGIRLSLGASAWDVERMILREGDALLGMGLAIGVALAFASSRFIEGLLFDVGPRNPVKLIGVTAVMAVIGPLACRIPARRAARIDPAISLRS